MIPNVVKGGDVRGLIRYLVDTREEHTQNVHVDPHVISGDGHLVAWHGSEILNFEAAHEIAAYIDEPRKQFGTEIRTKVWKSDPETGERIPETTTDPETGRRTQVYRDQHVWHCSLSLRPDEGPLSDEKWDAIANDFMDRMGFTDASGKSPCRWVAIHHGPSAGGNDHIHIAASMVREDGTRWEGRFRDFKTAQEKCRELEVEHDLVQVGGREQGTAARGEKRAESEKAARQGAEQTAPAQLADRIRAAAVASTSEAEWIRRVRGEGVVLKPHFAKGTTDVVTGYRAAIKPASRDQGLVFYGGGRLGRDLSLPRLREGWPTASVEAAQEAAAEWQAAFRGKPPVSTQGREARAVAETAPSVATANFADFNAKLSQVPIGDQTAWADAARDVSGTLSAWARHDPANAREFRAAAAALSRSAQVRRAPLPTGRRVKASSMGATFMLLGAKPEQRKKIAGVLLMQQVLKTVQALQDYHRARGHLAHVERLQRDVVDRLERVQLTGYKPVPPQGLTPAEEKAWEAQQIARQGQVPMTAPPAPAAGRKPGQGPLPRPLKPRRDQDPTREGQRNDDYSR